MFATVILDKYWRDFDFQQELGGRKVFPRPKEKDPWHPIFVGLRFCIILLKYVLLNSFSVQMKSLYAPLMILATGCLLATLAFIVEKYQGKYKSVVRRE